MSIAPIERFHIRVGQLHEYCLLNAPAANDDKPKVWFQSAPSTIVPYWKVSQCYSQIKCQPT